MSSKNVEPLINKEDLANATEYITNREKELEIERLRFVTGRNTDCAKVAESIRTCVKTAINKHEGKLTVYDLNYGSCNWANSVFYDLELAAKQNNIDLDISYFKNTMKKGYNIRVNIPDKKVDVNFW